MARKGEDRQKVADLIQKELRARRWKQATLAREINVAPSLINRILNKRRSLTEPMAKRIAAALRIDEEKLFSAAGHKYRPVPLANLTIEEVDQLLQLLGEGGVKAKHARHLIQNEANCRMVAHLIVSLYEGEKTIFLQQEGDALQT